MRLTWKLAFPLAAGAALLSGGAQAATRSDDALPSQATVKKQTPAAAPAQNAQGPKNGFPDTPGRGQAMDRANEHARFKRNDSAG